MENTSKNKKRDFENLEDDNSKDQLIKDEKKRKRGIINKY